MKTVLREAKEEVSSVFGSLSVYGPESISGAKIHSGTTLITGTTPAQLLFPSHNNFGK